MFHVYLLVCPLDGKVRYVGCSKDPKRRLIGHLFQRHGGWRKREWIAKLRRAKLKPRVFLWQSFTSREQAQAVERDLISHMSGLFNRMHNRHW